MPSAQALLAAGQSSTTPPPTQLDRILLELKELRREVRGHGAKIDDVIEAVRRGGGRKAEGGFTRQVTPLAQQVAGKSFAGLQGFEEAVRAQIPKLKERRASSSESLFDEIVPEQLVAAPRAKSPLQKPSRSTSSQQCPSRQQQKPQAGAEVLPTPFLDNLGGEAALHRLESLSNPGEAQQENVSAAPETLPSSILAPLDGAAKLQSPPNELASLVEQVESQREHVHEDRRRGLEAGSQPKPPCDGSHLKSLEKSPESEERGGMVNTDRVSQPAGSSQSAFRHSALEGASSPGGIRIIRRGDSVGNPGPGQGGGSSKTKQRGPSKVAWDVGFTEEPNAKPKRSAELPVLRENSGLLAGLVKGSVDTIRREMEKGIVKNAKAREKSDTTPTSTASPFATLLAAAAKRVTTVNSWALRLGGVLPCSAEHGCASRIYQWAVLLLHTVIFAGMVRQAQVSFGTDNAAFSIPDSVLTGGSVAGLIAAGAITGSRQLARTLSQLESTNEDTGFSSDVYQRTAVDTVLCLVVWLTFLSDRLSAVHILAPEGLRSLPWAEALRHAAVIVSSAQVFVLVLLVLRMSRNMSVLVDAFCTRFCQGMTYEESAVEWNVLQASVRMASNSVERCFAVLQSLLVLLALALVFDIKPLQGLEWALTAAGLLIVGMSQILLRAAEVTDACVRIPQLVNASDLSDDPKDQDRMYLVEYIHYSAAGFYVFNVRLGAGFAIKVLHYTGLIAFALARLVLPSGSQP